MHVCHLTNAIRIRKTANATGPRGPGRIIDRKTPCDVVITGASNYLQGNDPKESSEAKDQRLDRRFSENKVAPKTQ